MLSSLALADRTCAIMDSW